MRYVILPVRLRLFFSPEAVVMRWLALGTRMVRGSLWEAFSRLAVFAGRVPRPNMGGSRENPPWPAGVRHPQTGGVGSLTHKAVQRLLPGGDIIRQLKGKKRSRRRGKARKARREKAKSRARASPEQARFTILFRVLVFALMNLREAFDRLAIFAGTMPRLIEEEEHMNPPGRPGQFASAAQPPSMATRRWRHLILGMLHARRAEM